MSSLLPPFAAATLLLVVVCTAGGYSWLKSYVTLDIPYIAAIHVYETLVDETPTTAKAWPFSICSR